MARRLTRHADVNHRRDALNSLIGSPLHVSALATRAGDYGTCRDPATLIYRAGQRAGERVMFWRDAYGGRRRWPMRRRSQRSASASWRGVGGQIGRCSGNGCSP